MGEIVAERLLGTAFLAMFVSREAAVLQNGRAWLEEEEEEKGKEEEWDGCCGRMRACCSGSPSRNKKCERGGTCENTS